MIKTFIVIIMHHHDYQHHCHCQIIKVIIILCINSHAKSFLCAVFFETPIHKQDFDVSSKFCGPKNEVSKWLDSMNFHDESTQLASILVSMRQISRAFAPPFSREAPSTNSINLGHRFSRTKLPAGRFSEIV